MEYMIRKGIGIFSFTASDTPLSHGVRISSEILKRNLHLDFTILTRAIRHAQKRREKIIDQFRTIIRAGLTCVFFGVESGNDAVLKHVMNKGISSEDIAVTIECLRIASKQERRHVSIIASYIYPIPLPEKLLTQGITLEKVLEDNLKLLKRIRPDSFHAAPGLLYPGTKWYTDKEQFHIEFDEEHFLPKWITQEFSFHAFLNPQEDFLYSFNEIPFQELIPPSIDFARRGNELGFPSDLWDDHFIFARANGIEGAEALQQLSRDLFLDLLVCNDEHTHHLYEGVIDHSRQIAQRNHRFFVAC